MIAFLGVYEDWGESLLPPKEHRHEEGEDRSQCPNCKVNEAAGEMSAFELTAWNWYQETVSPFALEAGLVAEMFKGLGLAGKVQALFFKALNEIHRAFAQIRANMEKRLRDEMQGKG